MTEEGWDKLRYSLPKLSSQFMTPRQVYVAHVKDDNAGIMIKFNRNTKVVLYANGTWEQYVEQDEN